MRPSVLFALALVLGVPLLTGVAEHEYIYVGAVGVCVCLGIHAQPCYWLDLGHGTVAALPLLDCWVQQTPQG